MKLTKLNFEASSLHRFEETASASEICQVAYWVTQVMAQHKLTNITVAIPVGLEELSSGCSGGSKVGYLPAREYKILVLATSIFDCPL